MDLDACRDEVVFKLGRNVLLFQQLERTLKWIVPRLEVSGANAAELKDNFAKRQSSASKQTMGMNTGELFTDAEKDVSSQTWALVSSFAFEPETREEIEALVCERNELVHHFMDKVEVESPESWRKASIALDHQKERIAAIDALLRDLAAVLKSGIDTAVQEIHADLLQRD
ncbi:hypothetical protein [Congregibacter litoralis]|uniref:Uncharacterized protein n=1 Tax=Congregibacter litoralis KT71 TaxID=314285 RepID=A4AB60_9GAMM|nr:hypothetical protein [Congregibacter litoralis]EAQ96932.1 hypothetical protein KT71_11544 [Congregibacter litoralis KT71]